MTEQNEMMLRLIKDGKIVGYEYHHKPNHCGSCENNGNKNLIIEHSDNLEIFDMPHEHCQPFLDNKDLYIPHDSFNLSFKFGDEWIFEGDKVELIEIFFVDGTEYKSEYDGVVKFEDGCFKFECCEESEYLLPFIDGLNNPTITVTENIYEAKNE